MSKTGIYSRKRLSPNPMATQQIRRSDLVSISSIRFGSQLNARQETIKIPFS